MFRPWFMLILARYGQGKFGVRITNFISLNPSQGWVVIDLIWNTLCSQDNTRKSYDLFPVWSMMTCGL